MADIIYSTLFTAGKRVSVRITLLESDLHDINNVFNGLWSPEMRKAEQCFLESEVRP